MISMSITLPGSAADRKTSSEARLASSKKTQNQFAIITVIVPMREERMRTRSANAIAKTARNRVRN